MNRLKECPLCAGTNIKHKSLKTAKDQWGSNPSHQHTYIWICDDCPMIMFEFYDKTNTTTLNNYLEREAQNI